MKKLILVIIMVLIFTAQGMAADVELVVGDPKVMSIRQLSVTAATGALAATLSIPIQGTNYIELISIRLHLDAVGGTGNFTIIQDSVLGATYDTTILSQDMSSVADVYQTYNPGEAIYDNNDKIVFAYPNVNNKTYGLEVLYRQR